jgi:predicted nucleotidyltransferase
MPETIDRIIEVAHAIRMERYPDADAMCVGGSILRGEGTPFSDLDLVVVYAEIVRAFRESFRFGGYPIEAFVHDPETLEYFFVDVDRATGIPALPQLIVEAIEIPAPTTLSQELKRRAAALIEAGPPRLDDERERRMRYFLSDTLDDLRAPRNRDELVATGARLYEQLADYHLRRRGLWSAKGKDIPRVLGRADAALFARYRDAFTALFARGEPDAVVRLAEELMKDAGGPLFDGFRAEAPATCRKQRA